MLSEASAAVFQRCFIISLNCGLLFIYFIYFIFLWSTWNSLVRCFILKCYLNCLQPSIRGVCLSFCICLNVSFILVFQLHFAFFSLGSKFHSKKFERGAQFCPCTPLFFCFFYLDWDYSVLTGHTEHGKHGRSVSATEGQRSCSGAQELRRRPDTAKRRPTVEHTNPD